MGDFTKQAIIYFFLFIPVCFVIVVMMQGVEKYRKKKGQQGVMELGFGIFLMILIVSTYVLFIR